MGVTNYLNMRYLGRILKFLKLIQTLHGLLFITFSSIYFCLISPERLKNFVQKSEKNQFLVSNKQTVWIQPLTLLQQCRS